MKKFSLPCILYLYTDNFDHNNWDTYTSMLSPERKVRVNRAPTHYKPVLVFSELLIRSVASKILNIDFNKIRIDTNSYGKPFLPDYPQLHFNVSHSNKVVTIFFSDSPVGIDIEHIDSPHLKIADRFFANKEKEYVFSDDSQAITRFYEVWTRKEAYIKYLGKGLSVHLNSFDVFNEELDPFYKTYNIDNYIVSTFSTRKDLFLTPIKVTESDIWELLNQHP